VHRVSGRAPGARGMRAALRSGVHIEPKARNTRDRGIDVVLLGRERALSSLRAALECEDSLVVFVGVPTRDADQKRAFIVAAAHPMRDGASVAALLAAKSARPGRTLTIGEHARWVITPDGDRIEFRRQRALRSILLRLAEERMNAPGHAVRLADLVRSAWPAEKILPRAARNRVYVSVSKLRKLGLRDSIVSTDEGWLLDPDLVVQREQ
jgi:hypothetical protein